MSLIYYKLTGRAHSPIREYESAGFDLRSAINFSIESSKIPLDLQFMFPTGCYGRIASRSGLALKGIITLGGVIDADFRGNVCVILMNTSSETFHFKSGDKIAQIILEQYFHCEAEESHGPIPVENVKCRTCRGENGFGSSDYNNNQL